MAANPMNRNPSGKNGRDPCHPPDADLRDILLAYNRRSIFNRDRISKLLQVEHGIKMGAATVGRRLSAFGISASGATTKNMPLQEKRQLVLDQLGKDTTQMQGVQAIHEGITMDTGVTLTRAYIEKEMKTHADKAFEARKPHHKKPARIPLTSIGTDEELNADGHEKLSPIGFPIWGLREKFSGKWHGLWVVPNNRKMEVIASLYLSLVYELGGMPIQSTTNCSSETGLMYALANALREEFSPHIDIEEVPAHRFLRSVHNILIERGWRLLQIQWGDNVYNEFKRGEGTVYDPGNARHYKLTQWLWPKLIQQELDELKEKFNSHRVRRDHKKVLPSGVSPNEAYLLPHLYGGVRCLQPVDHAVIKELMEAVGGESLVQFVTPEYAAAAEEVFEHLGVENLSLQNVWSVFEAMLPLMPAP
ncbi:hypothetical protein BOTBODRAFT_176943 [Botryobasidium botryosum FD-172 SS1]|uniref:Integrase core domain-containing protein n=1 Tax=Botryobasidium botryosum (strain FD-172 SS1) TaxID=930990 RepID=A0A067MAN0_BOTB1|nr:hypothetical protein BOTBODRAFT_176943 [Botryobasidium botryosum FD-172 SS1]